jgi:hypothetical protein
MSVTIAPLGLTGSLRIIRDSDADDTVERNVNDGAATIYAVVIDNTANAAATYVKFYDTVGAITLGTTAPSMILMAPASVRRTFVFTGGNAFSTGLTYAAVTTGGTGGTTAPTSAVPVDIVVG